MRLVIESERLMTFGIEMDGRPFFLREHGGEWQIMERGAVIAAFKCKSGWIAALHRALIRIRGLIAEKGE